MALLNILQYPDPRLKKVAASIEHSEITSEKITSIITNMLETMYKENGVGLAAIQVNIPLQIVTIDISEHGNQPLCLINPIITNHQDEIDSEEGCLSFPGVIAKVKRYRQITVEFLDSSGNKQNISTDGLLSICIQHEVDHLKGITFFDRLSPLKRSLLEKKLNKFKNNYEQ